MTTSEFAKYKAPQFERPSIHKLPQVRAAESDDSEMPAENLGDLLGQVSKNSTSEIDSLIGELEQLRRKLQTDVDRIQREIEEHRALSQQVMQLTKIISEGVEKLQPFELQWIDSLTFRSDRDALKAISTKPQPWLRWLLRFFELTICFLRLG